MKLNNKSLKIVKISAKILCVFILLILILLTIYFVNKKNKVESDYGYIYKIRYDVVSESYVYLMSNNDIKTIIKSETFEIDPNCDCMVSTGKIHEEENIVDFSGDVKKEVIQVLDELYKKSGKRDFNANELNLTDDEKRILRATVLNCENCITIEDNVEYIVSEKEFLSDYNDYKILNSKVNLNNNTENDIVNNIANYLNDIIDKDFNEYNITSAELFIEDDLGVNLNLDLVYIGPYSLSFIYTSDGQLGATGIYNVKGYTFNYNGEVINFDTNDYRDEYYKSLLNSFKESDLFINCKDELISNWETIIYNVMFETGNWYYDKDDKITFLIPSYLLGLDGSYENVIEINVDNLEV